MSLFFLFIFTFLLLILLAGYFIIKIDSKKKVELVVFDAKEIESFTKENIDKLCNNPSAFDLP